MNLVINFTTWSHFSDIDPLAIDEDVANEEVVTESEPLPAAVTDTDGPSEFKLFRF